MQTLDQHCLNLVGHSMGANVVCLYASVRPERVRRVVDLESFEPTPQAPLRLATWLDELRDPLLLKPYASLGEVAERLMRRSTRGSRQHTRAFLPNTGHAARTTASTTCWPILPTSRPSRCCIGSTR